MVELKPVALKSSQVTMVQDKKGGWHVDGKLTVDKIVRDERGHIYMIQFAKADGTKAVWDEKA